LNARKWRTLLIGVAVLAAAWRIVPQSRPASSPPANQTSSAYVDPALCASCHQDIAKTYKLTGMGHSLYQPVAGSMVEDFTTRNTVHHEASGLTYTMVERDGKFYQRRSEKGFDGNETNVVEEQIDYIIGSGNHARSYLHRGLDGRLIELPVSWYVENSGYWAMSPGYDRKGQEDFRRAIPGECMLCHNGLPLKGSYPERGNTGLSVFPKEIPEGIDCQRCHGPGGAHVRAALDANTPREKIRQAIVNPARLTRERQLEVCMQCHLETSSSLMPNEIRRYNRTIDSYRPGEPLGDYKVYFDRAAGEGDRFGIAQIHLREGSESERARLVVETVHFGAELEQQLRGGLSHAGETAAHDDSLIFVCHVLRHHFPATLAGSQPRDRNITGVLHCGCLVFVRRACKVKYVAAEQHNLSSDCRSFR